MLGTDRNRYKSPVEKIASFARIPTWFARNRQRDGLLSITAYEVHIEGEFTTKYRRVCALFGDLLVGPRRHPG
jgi:hypothetical protein